MIAFARSEVDESVYRPGSVLQAMADMYKIRTTCSDIKRHEPT